MKIKKGFSVKRVAGSYMVIATGETRVNFNSMMTLNESGAFLFNKLSNGATSAELLDAMCAEYDADKATAQGDIDAFLQSVRAAGLIDE